MRPIDANAVVESLTNFTPNGWGKDVPYIKSEWAMAVKIKDNFMKAITEAPTIDAVEVVRCKDCKYFKTLLCQNEDNHENWFCADGERK